MDPRGTEFQLLRPRYSLSEYYAPPSIFVRRRISDPGKFPGGLATPSFPYSQPSSKYYIVSLIILNYLHKNSFQNK